MPEDGSRQTHFVASLAPVQCQLTRSASHCYAVGLLTPRASPNDGPQTSQLTSASTAPASIRYGSRTLGSHLFFAATLSTANAATPRLSSPTAQAWIWRSKRVGLSA